MQNEPERVSNKITKKTKCRFINVLLKLLIEAEIALKPGNIPMGERTMRGILCKLNLLS